MIPTTADSRQANALNAAASTSGSSKRPARFYRPELDLVRFLAFLLVFLTHTLPSGPDPSTTDMPEALQQVIYGCQKVSVFGLSLFFTLSAYLICELLLREREATCTISTKQFYIRRILRIWPLYFLALTIGLLIAVVLGGGRTFAWTAWAVVLLGNWFVVFRGFPGNVMFPLWSISVEEQFYLFAPWAVKFLNRRALWGFAFGLLLLSNLQLFYLGSVQAPDREIWYNSLVQFEDFSAGIFLCLLLHGRSLRNSTWSRILLIAASVLCWFGATFGFHIHTGVEAAPGSWSLIEGYGLIALGCCLLLVAFRGLNPKLLPGWAIYLGRISYGLYVFHMLAYHVAFRILAFHPLPGSLALLFKLATAMVLTILFASISYRYFESPFLRMKKRHEIIQSRPV